ncbi:TetR/AcrR family transcriptional regulator [Amycolatopsis pigmentata]|uniref:TetR/AcrR family transcriptional regulator n=1 Tax=Amycolatopsis pigmentata TaxID=450801 RepID=A0ABW5FJQ1_9PSEU
MARPADPERRGKTLARATDYVLEHGLAGLSLRPLATALGTSTRMLLYDFGSKEQLVSAILAEARRREAALLTDASAVESGRELLLGVWSWISASERRPFLRLFFETYLDAITHPESYSAEGKAMVTDWLNTFATALAPGGDDPVAATLVIAVIRGLLLDQLATGDQDRVDAALDRFADLLYAPPRTRER